MPARPREGKASTAPVWIPCSSSGQYVVLHLLPSTSGLEPPLLVKSRYHSFNVTGDNAINSNPVRVNFSLSKFCHFVESFAPSRVKRGDENCSENVSLRMPQKLAGSNPAPPSSRQLI